MYKDIENLGKLSYTDYQISKIKRAGNIIYDV